MFCPSQVGFYFILFSFFVPFFFLDSCLFSNGGGKMWILEYGKVGRSWEELENEIIIIIYDKNLFPI